LTAGIPAIEKARTCPINKQNFKPLLANLSIRIIYILLFKSSNAKILLSSSQMKGTISLSLPIYINIYKRIAVAIKAL
jgi:hypothetical protein